MYFCWIKIYCLKETPDICQSVINNLVHLTGDNHKWIDKFKNTLINFLFLAIHETSNNTTEKAILSLAIENIQKKQSLWNPLENNSNEIKTMIYLIEKCL